MPNEVQLIRSISDPSIVLDDIQSMDVENGTASTIGSPSSNVKYSNQYGGLFPLVQINGKTFDSEQIVSMEIRCTGFRPIASVTFYVRDKSFYSLHYPKDGDLLSIFIRSKDDSLKVIHNDYEITNVNVNTFPGGGETTPDDMTVTGVLRIPDLDAEKCFSKEGTSYDVLLSTANDLKLGFASNELDTSDSQTWICPFDKVSDFIYNVSLASWKDDKSFFTYFIDHYYYLNFVNVEPLFSAKATIDDALGLELLTQDFGKDSTQSKFQGKLVLSNWEDISGTNFFIQSYSLQNYSASINLSNGYKRYVQYYDALLKEYQFLYVDPKTTPGAEQDQIILKGRPNENFYKTQVKYKWLGVQYGNNGENAHEKINYAKINNYQNLVHLDKMQLVVNLENINLNLRRMQVIPIVIIVNKDYVRRKVNEPIDDQQEKSMPNSDEPTRDKSLMNAEELPFTIDKTISGNYVIKDIIYTYIQGQFKQQCVLIRREWPTPPQTHV